MTIGGVFYFGGADRDRLPLSALFAPRLQAGLTRDQQSWCPLAPPFDPDSKARNAVAF